MYRYVYRYRYVLYIYICTISIHFSWHRHLYGYLRQENGTIRNTMFEFMWWIALWYTNQTGFFGKSITYRRLYQKNLHFYGISDSFLCLVFLTNFPILSGRFYSLWENLIGYQPSGFQPHFVIGPRLGLVVVLHSNTLPFAIENGHCLVDFAMNNWWFSTAMSVYQRVCPIKSH